MKNNDNIQIQSGYTGVFGGGPIYNDPKTTLAELKNSGFSEVIVWNIKVRPTGELNFNGEFPLVSDGVYIGDKFHPEFRGTLKSLKSAQVKRITFSIGSSAEGDFKNIKDLINKEGTGVNSILYKNFKALKGAIPVLDAIDLDDEYEYDANSIIDFSVMLGKLGLHVVPDVYTKKEYWQDVVSRINSKLPGTVDAVHLQTYDGGSGNNPCEWLFGEVPTLPGVWKQQGDPAEIKRMFSTWNKQCSVKGGFFWLYDDVSKKDTARLYAAAINDGIKS